MSRIANCVRKLGLACPRYVWTGVLGAVLCASVVAAQGPAAAQPPGEKPATGSSSLALRVTDAAAQPPDEKPATGSSSLALRGTDAAAQPPGEKPATGSSSLALRVTDEAEKPATEKPATDKPVGPAPFDDEELKTLELFVDTLDQIQRNYVKEVSRRELMEAAIRGMLSKLDPYSDYIPPDDIEGFKGSVENEFGGIGIQVGVENGRLTVVTPLVGAPAYKAGIKAGDWIEAIDGERARDLSLDDAVKRMKGKVGTHVKLTVVHGKDGRREEIDLERRTVRVDTVLGDKRADDDSWDYWLDSDQKIAYIRITNFGRHTTQELTAAMRKLVDQGLKGLVLDLRFNPGGLLTSAIEVSDLFVADGRIVSTAGRNVREQVVMAKKPGTLEGFPMAVLVNRFSASASEIVSACLQDHDRAIVVGERTWGKASVQNIVELESGRSALKLTTAGYMRPSGKNIHRHEGASDEDEWGVKPNDGYEIRLAAEEIRRLIDARERRDIVRPRDGKDQPVEDGDFRDRQLQKAVEYVVGKIPASAKPAPDKPADEKPTADKPTADKPTEKPDEKKPSAP